MKFRKKPVVIEAVLWDETKTTLRQLESMGMRWLGHTGHAERPDECRHLRIETLEGGISATLGDWIIRGVKGEFYLCKPDIFAATYDAVVED